MLATQNTSINRTSSTWCVAEPSPEPGEPNLEPALDRPFPGVSNPCMPVPDPLEGGLQVFFTIFQLFVYFHNNVDLFYVP